MADNRNNNRGSYTIEQLNQRKQAQLSDSRAASMQPRPMQQKPMQQKPMQQRPMQQRPMQQKPMQQKPMQQRPMQQKPIQQRAVKQSSPNSRPVPVQGRAMKPNRPVVQGQSREAAISHPVKKKAKYYYDYSLLASVILLATFGLLMVYSSSQYVAMVNKGSSNYYFKRQLIIFGGCLGGCLIFSKLLRRVFNYKMLKPLSGIILGIACIIQLMTLVMGLSSHGKTRWISIMGINFQPAEITKLAIIIFLAAAIAKLGYKVSQPKNILKLCLIIFFPVMSILSENLSSGIITAGIAFVMLFVACRQTKVFVALAAMGLTAILGLKPLLHEVIVRLNLGRPDQYQLRRVFGWAAPELFPTDAYQTMQGLYAIGSGGIVGQGLGESIQKFGKLPEAHNDMIFPIVVEELGLLGAMAIVLLFLFLIYRLAQIATNSNDLFGSMICVGIIAHISIQVILNIAVVTGVIPNTGVTLPFISYGGSAILCTMAEITLALNISSYIRLE